MDKNELFNCSENRVFSKTAKFWEKNKSNFPLYYQKYFMANIFEMIEQNDISIVDDITLTIFNYLDVLNIDFDKESQFLSFFEQYYNVNNFYSRNMVEITQNYVPVISKKIADIKAKNHLSGTIKSYGSNLIDCNDSSLEINRKNYDIRDSYERDDLLVSFTPRDDVDSLLRAAIENKKELLLNLSGYMDDERSKLDSLLKYSASNMDGNFELDIVNYSLDSDIALVLKRK